MHAIITIFPTLSAKRIATLIAASANKHAKTVNIEVVAVTGSTNADLRNRINTLTKPTLLIAETQTAGRGRAGRAWQTTEMSTLTFSLAWPFHRPINTLIGLPLALGVALVEMLTILGIHSTLKWPNDILRNNAKLAGILIETAKKTTANIVQTWTINGIGLNLIVPSNLRHGIGYAIADAPELQKQDRAKLIALLLNTLSNALVKFEKQGFSPFMKKWNQFHAYSGRVVQIFDNSRILYAGTAIGVDNRGCLLIDTINSGRIAIAAGDVSLRLQEQY